jgi:hypothetical protein
MTADRDAAAKQLLLDRAEIHDVMMRYAAGVDSRDFDMVTDCFTPDVDVQGWGGLTFEDRTALVGFIRGVANFHTTMHMMGNQFIEVTGDQAAMDTYAMLTHHMDQPDGNTFELNLSGNRYVEKLSRIDGRWTIHQRGGDPAWGPTGVTGAAADDPALRWLLDRAEIHDLMMQYALGIDLHEYDRIRACFAPQFAAAYGPLGTFTDIDKLIEFIKGVEHFASTTHFLGTQLIEVQGDEALMETYAMITHRPNGGGDEWMPGGSSYRDRLARIDGRWKIVERGEDVAAVPTGSATVPTSEDAAVQLLLDRAAIHDVVATTALAADRRQYDLFRTCFTDDAVDAQLTETQAENEQWDSTCHFLNNQLIDVDGDTAEVETYAYITHKAKGEMMPSAWSKGARRFVDSLVRTDGRWVIRKRQLTDNRIEADAAAST